MYDCVNNKLETVGKEEIVGYSEVLFQHFPEWTEEKPKNPVSIIGPET
jgi:hypothetical protein